VQNMLVGALGDLQAVWSSAEEKALLLALPLPAMQLLLSSDLVRVPSEDSAVHGSAVCAGAGAASKQSSSQGSTSAAHTCSSCRRLRCAVQPWQQATLSICSTLMRSSCRACSC
jgi:hypothetical protein